MSEKNPLINVAFLIQEMNIILVNQFYFMNHSGQNVISIEK